MVSGSVGFAPNPADGLIFFVEPSRGLSATILQNTEELTSSPMKHTLFAIAAVLLFSSAMLSTDRLGDQAADAALLLRGSGHVSTPTAVAPEPATAPRPHPPGRDERILAADRPDRPRHSRGPSACCSA